MRLASYRLRDGRVLSGAVCRADATGGDHLVPLSTLLEMMGPGPWSDLGGRPSLADLIGCGWEATVDALAGCLADVDEGELQAKASWHPADDVELLAPVMAQTMLYVGQNFPSHVGELKAERRRDPAAAPRFFAKLPRCATGHRAVVRPPRDEPLIDYEAELGVIISKPTHRVSVSQAMRHVAGYTVLNDLSARRTQIAEMERGVLLHGKNFAGSAPMGPWMVPAHEIGDVQSLEIRCEVDGEIRQHDNTSSMTWSVAELIAAASQVPLGPGDVIGTGTPGGIGWNGEDDSRLLRPGQIVQTTIEAIGTLETYIESVTYP